ncbi:MAG: hypothetical protein CMF49_06170 [Legionellales bacterium]|mgnify:CR=1 FL=1|nr:hypothetical protein [Legionellales bacterium]|tara:strand:+ start:2792 stop:3328 length:537 start_codon:yes stop_codon:yes gene_type:complete
MLDFKAEIDTLIEQYEEIKELSDIGQEPQTNELLGFEPGKLVSNVTIREKKNEILTLIKCKIIALHKLSLCQTNRTDELERVCKYVLDATDLTYGFDFNLQVFKASFLLYSLVNSINKIPEPIRFGFYTTKGSRLKKTLNDIFEKIMNEDTFEKEFSNITNPRFKTITRFKTTKSARK